MRNRRSRAENARTGACTTRAARETDGASVEKEFILPAGCLPPPPHVHPRQVESYKVLEGNLEIVIDGAWSALGPGDSASVPLGESHTFRNRSGALGRVQNRHEPAMQFEEFIERVSGTLRAAGVKSERDPRTLTYMSMAMMDFPDTLRPARKRERIPMQALAWIGRRLGLGHSFK